MRPFFFQSGLIHTKDEAYFMEPLPVHLHNKVTTSGRSKPHIIYRRSVNSNPKQNFHVIKEKREIHTCGTAGKGPVITYRTGAGGVGRFLESTWEGTLKNWLPMCGIIRILQVPMGGSDTFFCDTSKTIRPPFSWQRIMTSPWNTLLWKIKLLLCILYGCVLKSFAKDSLPSCRWPAYSLSTSIEWNAAVCATWTSRTWGREIHWDPGGGWSKDDELSRRGRRQTIRTVCL